MNNNTTTIDDSDDKIIFSSRLTVSQLIDHINDTIDEDDERSDFLVSLSEADYEKLGRRVNDAIAAVIVDFVNDLIYEVESN